jgi:hypothetical protein
MLKNKILWLVALLSLAGTAAGQEHQAADAESRHVAFLSWETGTWDAAITLFSPGGDPVRFTGEQVDRMGACGLWLITDLRLLDAADGQPAPPYEGHGVIGFDPERQKLVGLWVDSKTTWLAKAEGSVDEAGKALTLDVEGRHPVTGEVMMQRFITTRLGENSRLLETYVPGPRGDLIKVASIEYTRRPATASTANVKVMAE